MNNKASIKKKRKSKIKRKSKRKYTKKTKKKIGGNWKMQNPFEKIIEKKDACVTSLVKKK